MQQVIFLLMMLTLTYADYPALKVLLSEKGLADVAQMMSVWIKSKMMSAEIPEVRGGLDIRIGTVHYVMSNMQAVQCSMTEPSLVFIKGTGVSVDVSHLSVAITGRWATQFGIIHDSGSFDLTVYDLRINTLLQLGDEAGHLSIATGYCSDDVGGVDIQFHGGASFFFKPFVSSFRGKISGMIREKICPATQQVVNALDKNLQGIPVNIPVDQHVYVSVPLTSSPAVMDQSFELDMKGEFYSNSSPSEPPFSAGAFDMQSAGNYMLSLAASQFMVNSAAYAYFCSGLLQINITDDMIPKSSPIHLNTSQFGVFIPQLRTLYPNMEMQMLLYARETPLLSFSSGLMDLHVAAAAKFCAVKPDGAPVPLFRLDVDANLSGNALIEKKTLTGAFKMNNLTLTLGSSEIGDFETTTIEHMLLIAVNTVILPRVNAYLKTGFLLPTLHNISLVNPQLLIKNGFVVIFTDVKDSLQAEIWTA